jgi:hypothetical protein
VAICLAVYQSTGPPPRCRSICRCNRCVCRAAGCYSAQHARRRSLVNARRHRPARMRLLPCNTPPACCPLSRAHLKLVIGPPPRPSYPRGFAPPTVIRSWHTHRSFCVDAVWAHASAGPAPSLHVKGDPLHTPLPRQRPASRAPPAGVPGREARRPPRPFCRNNLTRPHSLRAVFLRARGRARASTNPALTVSFPLWDLPPCVSAPLDASSAPFPYSLRPLAEAAPGKEGAARKGAGCRPGAHPPHPRPNNPFTRHTALPPRPAPPTVATAASPPGAWRAV